MEYYPLSKDLIPKLSELFSDIVRIWCKWHKTTPDDYSAVIERWKLMIAKGELLGLVGIHDGQAVSMIWKEQPQPTYATVVVHSLGNVEDLGIVHTFIEQNFVSNLVFELIQYTDGFGYRDTFIDHGFFEKERQRMVFEIPENFQDLDYDQSIEFIPIQGDSDTVAKLSCKAHFSRKFIEGYAEFTIEEKRKTMSEKLHYSPGSDYLDYASLLMKVDGKVVGVCEVVTWKIWGDEPIAWIMDIAIDPAHHGLGYGYQLLHKLVYQLKNKHQMPKVGLSVTLSNTGAKSLYDRFGFKDYEFYVEMIDPQAIKNQASS